MSYRNETIKKAYYCTRPMNMGGHKVDYDTICHHGVVVETDEGNRWLIHNGPGSGVVCTSASNMSKEWRKVRDIEVSRDAKHTVGGCLREAGAWSKNVFDNSNPVKQYLASGLCIGSAERVESHLNGREKLDFDYCGGECPIYFRSNGKNTEWSVNISVPCLII